MLPAFSPSSLLLRRIVFLEVLSRLPLSLMRVTYLHLGESYLLIVYLYFSNWLSVHIFWYHWLLWCLLALKVFSFSQVTECTFHRSTSYGHQNKAHYIRAGIAVRKLDKCYLILWQLRFVYSFKWSSQLLIKADNIPLTQYVWSLITLLICLVNGTRDLNQQWMIVSFFCSVRLANDSYSRDFTRSS